MVQEIVELFLQQAPRFMEDMVMCVRQSRWSDLHPLAHKLKSSVTMLGMTGLAPLVLEIERTSKFGGNPSTLPQLVSDLTSQMEAVCRAISQDLSEAMVLNASASTRLRRA
ncbi:MAG: Hpt domain-containing protein [Bacteroidota bacterium]|nr:Hpt domain-containing protein [Bacteroidota bacterium]